MQSVTFNGATLERSWLTARELHLGGSLRFRLGPEPSAWATDERPPSVSNPGEGYPERSAPLLPTTPTVQPDLADPGLVLDASEMETA